MLQVRTFRGETAVREMMQKMRRVPQGEPSRRRKQVGKKVRKSGRDNEGGNALAGGWGRQAKKIKV